MSGAGGRQRRQPWHLTAHRSTRRHRRYVATRERRRSRGRATAERARPFVERRSVRSFGAVASGAYTPFPDNCIWTSSASESWMPNCRSCATSSHARAQCQRRAHRRNGLPGRLARYPSEPCRVGVHRQSSAGVEVLKSFLVRVMRGRSRETRRCTARSGRGVTTRPPAHRRPQVRGPLSEVKDPGRGHRRRYADGEPLDEPVDVQSRRGLAPSATSIAVPHSDHRRPRGGAPPRRMPSRRNER